MKHTSLHLLRSYGFIGSYFTLTFVELWRRNRRSRRTPFGSLTITRTVSGWSAAGSMSSWFLASSLNFCRSCDKPVSSSTTGAHFRCCIHILNASSLWKTSSQDNFSPSTAAASAFQWHHGRWWLRTDSCVILTVSTVRESCQSTVHAIFSSNLSASRRQRSVGAVFFNCARCSTSERIWHPTR